MEFHCPKNLSELVEFKKDSISSNVLSKNGDFTALLIAIKKEQLLSEHKSDVNAFLYVLEGEVEYRNKNEKYTVKKGEVLFFPALELHSVYGNKDSKILVIRI